VLGGVSIVVPPWLPVVAEGTGNHGGFEAQTRAPPVPDPEAPLLRVHGLAVFGGVEVATRLPGESRHGAHRRHRRGRRHRR
jgi:hypothetical protein